MSTRSSRSSVSSEEDTRHTTSSKQVNPHVGTSVGGSAPQSTSRGADSLQGVKGHVPQQGFHTKSLFPRDLPPFDGQTENWDKWESEITYAVHQLTGIDLTLSVKPHIETGLNRFIFQCISKCVNGRLYDIICRHKGKGYEAYKFLEQTVNGTIQYRQTKVVREQAELKFHDHETVLEFTSRLSKVCRDGLKYGMGEQPNANDTYPVLITRSLMHLPKRFDDWAERKLSLWQEEEGAHFPTIDRYIDLLIDQDKIARRSNTNQNGRGNSYISCPGAGASNISNISLNKKDNKLSKNQRRKMRIKLKQATVANNVDNSQVQHNIQNQTTGLNAATFRQNNNKPGRAPNKQWRQKQNLSTQTGGGGGLGSTSAVQGQGYASASRPQHQSSYKDTRPPISCKRCLSRKGTHTAENCPVMKYCNHCKNGSHMTIDCSVKPGQ